ncbi:hypothetical protein C8R48DRAFT_780951 [Suillus tomentosus]|nr:hypothetical protein C8R48DRAFT_780951 [Suillus tomentosus]
MPVSSTVLNENFNRSVDSGFIDITTGLPAAAVATPSRLSPHERVKSVVKIFREGRMSILDFILRILDPSQPDFMYNRDWIYNPSKVEKENSGDGQRVSGKLEQMFDRLFADSRGRARMLEWFHPHAVAYISLTVSNEMDAVKEALRGTLDSVTPQFLSTWDLSTTIQDKVALKAPILHSENVIVYFVFYNTC